jgi:hypothetical protein
VSQIIRTFTCHGQPGIAGSGRDDSRRGSVGADTREVLPERRIRRVVRCRVAQARGECGQRAGVGECFEQRRQGRLRSGDYHGETFDPTMCMHPDIRWYPVDSRAEQQPGVCRRCGAQQFRSTTDPDSFVPQQITEEYLRAVSQAQIDAYLAAHPETDERTPE